MTIPAAIEVPVLIVGAGPGGLCASILLSHHGVQSLTVERHPGTSIYPRATAINVRTMEIFRSLGLEQRVRDASFEAWPRIAHSTVLVSPDPDSSPVAPRGPGVSPARWTSCAQSELEPILLQEAASHAQAQLMFGTQVLEFDAGRDDITTLIADRATGRVCTVPCQYLMAPTAPRARFASEPESRCMESVSWPRSWAST
jgi:putative polyketide hydroxylase